jgi:phosphoribosyl 1,2-cyclic phosphodiesterase
MQSITMLDFKFISLASGSKGNSLVIQTQETTIMIDCGGPKHYLMNALNEHHIKLEDIDACFITHQHSDHIQQIKTFSQRPIYSTQAIPNVNPTIIQPLERIDVNECVVVAFTLSHDVSNVGYIVYTRHCKIVCVSDTGYLRLEDIALLSNADFYYFESNYEPAMLLSSKRHHMVKMRTISDNGHLSNDDSARYLKAMIGPKTKEVMLAHISEDSNTFSLAIMAHAQAWLEEYPSIRLTCARQFEVSLGGNYD